MIKKLRRRFMLVTVLIFTFIIVAVAAGIFGLMLNSEAKESAAIMDFAFSGMNDRNAPRNSKPSDSQPAPQNHSNADFLFGTDRKTPNSMFRNWITIELDSDRSVTMLFRSMNKDIEDQDSTDTNDSIISENAVTLAAKGDSSGQITIDGVMYRYLVKTGSSDLPYAYKVVLLDRSVEIATMQRLGAVIGIIAAAGIAVVFVLSIFLSKWAVKPIEEAWRKQKEFIANASHELKTPLTVIAANTDVIMSNPDDTVANQSKWFGYIREEADKMSKLVTSMLYLAREDRDDDKIVMTEFNGSEVIEGACLAFEALIYEKGKTLETEIEPDVLCSGDKERIAQLAHILIDNAVSHSADNGYIKVTFRKQKNKVRLTVENNGEAIPKEELPHLFERYYRTDKSHNSDKGGFGLGLSIAKMLVDKHNGTITAASSENGITRFTVKW